MKGDMISTYLLEIQVYYLCRIYIQHHKCCDAVSQKRRIIKFSLVLQNYLHEERHNFHIFTGNISILSLQSMPTAS
jgi:hypothetical protein